MLTFIWFRKTFSVLVNQSQHWASLINLHYITRTNFKSFWKKTKANFKFFKISLINLTVHWSFNLFIWYCIYYTFHLKFTFILKWASNKDLWPRLGIFCRWSVHSQSTWNLLLLSDFSSKMEENTHEFLTWYYNTIVAWEHISFDKGGWSHSFRFTESESSTIVL